MIRPEQYVNHPGFAQSDLKIFRESPFRFKREVIDGQRILKEETDPTDIGNLADCICTNKEGLSDYWIAPNIDCSDSLKEITRRAIELIDLYLQDPATRNTFNTQALQVSFSHYEGSNADQFMLKAAREKGYQPKWGDDALLNTFKKNCIAYYEAYYNNKHKQIIDTEIYAQAEASANKLLTHPIIGKLLHPDQIAMQKKQGFDIAFQVMHTLDTEYGFFIKMLADVLHFDHKKLIIRPYDIKTAASIKQFVISYFKRTYGLQGAMYRYILKMIFPDYTVQPFRFLVAPTETEEPACIYKQSEQEYELHLKGGITNGGHQIEGLFQTLDRIHYHMENNLWDYPREYYINEGELIINSLNDGAIFAGTESSWSDIL